MGIIKYRNSNSITPADKAFRHILNINTKFLIIFCVFLMITPLLLTATAHPTIKEPITLTSFTQQTNQKDLLIILSPAYAKDPDINHKINQYTQTIQTDINWTSRLITLLPQQNTYTIIDTIIEQIYHINQIKACLLIGDDLDLPVSGTYQNKTKPSIIPWATLGGNTNYDIHNSHIISTSYQTDVFISLLIPNPTLTYSERKNHILNTLESFITKRNTYQLENTTITGSSQLHTNKTRYPVNIGKEHNSLIDPTIHQLQQTIQQTHSIYLINGHSDPSKTLLNHQNNTWFTINHLKTLHTSIFLADGCYVNGYWTNTRDEPSPSSYAHILCENPEIQVMILGIISQRNQQTTIPLQQSFSQLSEGNTLAESFLGQTINGDIIFYGDPTFHFTTQAIE